MEHLRPDDAGGDAMRAVIDLLHLAPPADVTTLLAELPDDELALGLAGTAWPLPSSVVDHIVERGTPPLWIGLARRLRDPGLLDEPCANEVRRRLLKLSDPGVDDVLFDFEGDYVPWWVGVAIVRDRRTGPGGTISLSPDMKARLLQTAAALKIEHDEEIAYGGTVRFLNRRHGIVGVLLAADDPDLVLAGLKLMGRSQGTLSTALPRAMATLAQHGQAGETADLAFWAETEQSAHGSSEMTNRRLMRIRDGDPTAAEDLRDATPPNMWARMVEESRRSVNSFAAIAHSLENEHAGFALPWPDVLAWAGYIGAGFCRGLRAAARREDCPPDVRAELEAAHPRAALESRHPTRPTVEAAGRMLRRARAGAIDDTAVADRILRPAGMEPPGVLQAVWLLTVRGFEAESLTPSDLLSCPSLGWQALMAAVPDGPFRHHTPRGFGSSIRARAALRAELTAMLVARIGDDLEKWLVLLPSAASWQGSVEELVNRVADGEIDGEVDGEPAGSAAAWSPPEDTWIHPAAVFLALAPPGVIDEVLRESGRPGVRGVLAQLLSSRPFIPALGDFALTETAADLRIAMAAGQTASDEYWWRIIRREPAERDVFAALFLNRGASEAMRWELVRRSHVFGGLRSVPEVWRMAVRGPHLTRPFLAAADAGVVLETLKMLGPKADADYRAFAYARLADLAGPEIVWALELERAGSLSLMADDVREAMAFGTAPAPRSPPAFAVALAKREAEGSVPPPERPIPARAVGTALYTESAALWQSTDGVREHLSGRPERWREAVRLLRDGFDGSVAELTERVVAAAPLL